MAVKAVNNTTGLNGLVSTLLVYRAYPRISNLDPPALSITEQVAAIQKAMAEIVKLQAKQTVNNALHYCNRPNTTLVHDLPLNSEVLIWRESGNWNGPYRLLAIENETCCVQLPSGPTSFRSTTVKPYFRSEDTYDIKPDKREVLLPTLEVPQEPTELTTKCGQGRPQKHPANENLVTENYLSSVGISASSAGASASSAGTFTSSAGISARQSLYADILVLVQETPFTDSRRKEINKLLKKGVFAVIIKRDVP